MSRQKTSKEPFSRYKKAIAEIQKNFYAAGPALTGRAEIIKSVQRFFASEKVRKILLSEWVNDPG